MKFKLRKNHGMSLLEVMTAVAITGIVALAISSIYTNYTNQKYALESKASSQIDFDTASKYIKNLLPTLISNTVGTNGTINPSGNWTCPTGGPCTLKVSASAGAASTSTVINVTCDALPSPLPSGLNLDTLFQDSSAPAGACVQCSAGKRPVIHVIMNPAAGSPEIKFPTNMSFGQGTLASGLCFNAQAYDRNAGIAGAAVDNRYDRWSITLNFAYISAPLPPNATITQILQSFRLITERVMLAAPVQLGSDINFTPN